MCAGSRSSHAPVTFVVTRKACRIIIKPAGIASIDGIVSRQPVQVDPAPVPNQVTGHEPPRQRIVVAMRQQVQARIVSIIPPLAPEPYRLMQIIRTLRVKETIAPESVKRQSRRHLHRRPVEGLGAQNHRLHQVPLRVIGVRTVGDLRRVAPGSGVVAVAPFQPRRAEENVEQVFAVAVLLGDRLIAVVEVVGGGTEGVIAGAVVAPSPQAVAVVACQQELLIGDGQAIFGIIESEVAVGSGFLAQRRIWYPDIG
jgi:hypothetical protein